MIFQIADFVVDFSCKYALLKQRGCDYRLPDGDCEMFFILSQADIDTEKSLETKRMNVRDSFYEFSAAYRKLAEWVPTHDAVLMHGTLFDVRGTGVLFTALSGTGKTTHMMLWKKLLGDQMTIVNGDKPIMRFLDGGLFGYGTPWNGKERLGCNMRTPLKHICFIKRSETNYVERIDKETAIARLMQQIYMPKDATARALTFSLAERILDACDLWIIHCNMDPAAAEISYNTIFNHTKEELEK